MDPFSGEGELLNISTAFYTHSYQDVLDSDTSALSAENKAAAQILKYRAQIALGQGAAVVSALKSSKDAASRSIVALAQYASDSASAAAAVQTASELAASDGEDAVVQISAGTVLAAAGEYAAAIALLGKHKGSLEAVALLVQIHLMQNRADLAVKEVAAAKRWANDSLLINLAEAWLNLRQGGQERYQSAFYVYEELATTPGTTSPTALVGQALSEIHLGRWEEAEAALTQALAAEKPHVEAIANSIVLAAITGKKRDQIANLTAKLESASGSGGTIHALLVDLREKSELFDTAAQKYRPTKVA